MATESVEQQAAFLERLRELRSLADEADGPEQGMAPGRSINWENWGDWGSFANWFKFE
jgi:hypothetical protein